MGRLSLAYLFCTSWEVMKAMYFQASSAWPLLAVTPRPMEPLTADDVLFSYERKYNSTSITPFVSSPAITKPADQFNLALADYIAPVESGVTSAEDRPTSDAEPAIEVEFAGKVRVRIPGSVPAALAAAVVKVLARR